MSKPTRTPDDAVACDWTQVVHWRMQRQRLDERDARGTHVVNAERLCGVHAQLMSSAELALWSRVDGLEPGVVGQELYETRALVKTWAMRGTLHLFASSRFPTVLAALRTQRGYNDGLLRAFGMTAAEMERVTEAIPQALDGKCLTRQELSGEVKRITRSRRLAELASQSWGDLLKPAAYRGYLCAGPPRGRNVTFVRLDQWLPDVREPQLDDPLAEVFRRYLEVYGPASREDFARWWGVNPPTVSRLIDRMADELQPMNIEGYRGWLLRDHVSGLTSAGSADGVRIVPGFDAYVVSSFRHADHLLPDDVPKTVVYRPQGWVSPVVLVAGRFAGVWKHDAARRGCIRVELFQRLRPKTLRKLKIEIDLVRGFLGFAGEVAFE